MNIVQNDENIENIDDFDEHLETDVLDDVEIEIHLDEVEDELDEIE